MGVDSRYSEAYSRYIRYGQGETRNSARIKASKATTLAELRLAVEQCDAATKRYVERIYAEHGVLV